MTDRQESRTPIRERSVSTLLVAGLLLGLILRIAVVASPAYNLDSDTAIVYLMSAHASRGEFALFFWGQSYGGTLIQLLSGAIMAVVGTSYLVVSAVEISLALGAALLVNFVVRRAISPLAGVVATLVFWLPGFFLIRLSTIDPGFYSSSILVAMLAVALAVWERPWRNPIFGWVALGALAGLSFWMSLAGIALASGALIPALARKSARKSLGWVIPGGILGVTPWVIGFLTGDRRKALTGFSAPFDDFLGRASRMVTEVIPNAVSGSIPGPIAILVGLTALAFVIAGAVLSIRERYWGALALIVGAPLVSLALVLAGSHLGFEERRYVEFLLPALGASIAVVGARSLWIARIFVAAVVLGSVVGVGLGTGFAVRNDRASVFGTDTSAMVELLEQRNVDTLWAGYWQAYVLTAASGEQVVVGSFPFSRYQAYDVRAARSSTSAIVVVHGSLNEDLLNGASAPVPSRRTEVGGLVLFQYSGRIDPASLGLSLF